MKKNDENNTMSSLIQALDLTREMFNNAESGTWDVLPDLESERDQLIKQFFSQYQGKRTPELESVVNEIQTINQNLLRLVLSARDGLKLEMSQFKRSGKAARAYIQHSN